MRNARIHSLLFYLVISYVGIVEGQVTTALFTSPVISIPFTRVGNQDYSDIVLKWDGSLGFDVLTVGSASQALPNIPTAEYSQATNILKIHSLSIAGRSYRNATFKVLPQLALHNSEASKFRNLLGEMIFVHLLNLNEKFVATESQSKVSREGVL